MAKLKCLSYYRVFVRSVTFIGVFSLYLYLSEALAQSFPSGFSRVLVANGISNPTAVAFSPDGRIFVCEQGGRLRVVKNNVLLPTPFVTLSVNTQGERGLLGIAFDPDFVTNLFVYLYYTLPDGSRNRVSRFTANGDVVIDGSELVLLDLDPLGAIFHNGGAMNFGPDNKLYIAIGENGISTNSQNFNTYHGKLIRINTDGSVPAGNPFTDGSEQRRRTWSLGLRNPFTFTFQPGTGKLFVNDVGAMLWEEINDATNGGLNFGWPSNEGIVAGTMFTNPIYAYGHGAGDGIGCAITGGVFFNPAVTTYPNTFYGKYFFMDLCGAWINYVDPVPGASRNSFGTSIGNQAVGLSLGSDGNLYFLSRANGALYKIVYTSNQSPAITSHPSPVDKFVGESATFSVSASGAQPMSYQWRKNGVDISGAVSIDLVIPSVSASDAGMYSVRVSNSFGNVVSNEAALTILGSNEAPNPSILTPVEGTMYRGGDLISFSGNATDPEDGVIPANGLQWQVVFHHGTHVHDSPPIPGIASGEFTIPVVGEVSDDVWYRLYFTARDAQGRESSVFRDILPYKSTITLATQPSGLQLTLDGQPVTPPHTVVGVEGIQREIGAPSPQVVTGVEFQFDHWEHGGTAVHAIATPQDDVTYTAVFNVITSIGPDFDLKSAISVYPNPVKDHLVLTNVPESNIQLINSVGKIVHEINLNKKEERLRLDLNMNDGFYFIKVITNHDIITRKFIVIH